MKKKFNTLLYAMIALTAVSCTASRSAMAQSDNGYYQDQSQPQYNNNNDAYNDNSANNNSQDYSNNQQYDNTTDPNYDNGNYQDQDNAGDYDNNYSDDNSNGQPDDDININTFNDALSPYGTWENDPTYGRVWVCNDQGFVPYSTDGHWVYTDYGWTWVSDYEWGWAPFHYGRWAYSNASWMWVPGYQWAPAWVNWRNSNDYYGWAPMAPRIGFGLGIGFGGGFGYLPAARWNFLPHAFLGSLFPGRFLIGGARAENIFRSTTVINNRTVFGRASYAAGPNRAEAERYSGRSIQTARINNAARPGASFASGNGVSMYRPSMRSNAGVNNSVSNRFNTASAREATNNNRFAANNSFNQSRMQPQQQHAVNNFSQQRTNTSFNNNNNYNRSFAQNSFANRVQTMPSSNSFAQRQSFANTQRSNYNYSRSNSSYNNYSRPSSNYRAAAPSYRASASGRSYAAAPRQESSRSFGGGGSRSYSGGGHSSGGRSGRR